MLSSPPGLLLLVDLEEPIPKTTNGSFSIQSSNAGLVSSQSQNLFSLPFADNKFPRKKIG